MSELEDLNNNLTSDVVSEEVSSVPFRPRLARAPKKVQFPTLQDIDKNTAPPGSTPISSWTNIFTAKNTKQSPRTPTKLIDSSTSLEVETDGTFSSASLCTTITNPSDAPTSTATTSTYVLDTPKEHHSLYKEHLTYLPPRLPPPKRGRSVPATRTVSTEPMESSMTSKNNTTQSTASKSTVGPSFSRNFNTKLKFTLPLNSTTGFSIRNLSSSCDVNNATLRKSLLAAKDNNNNSNFVDKSINTPNNSNTSTVAPIYGSADVSADGIESIKNEVWESIGKSYVPVAAIPSAKSKRMSRHNREYRTPRTRSTLSSNESFFNEREMISLGGNNSMSADTLPPLLTEMRGGRNVKSQLSNLTNILSTLRQKEVVFDRASAIQALQARILRGERVTHEEIKAIRNMTLPPHQRHLGYRLPWSTDLYCVKGLIHIPTPNKQSPLKNTFGTIDDLRIPFNDRMTMEHYGRRHYILDLAGFEDDHISLYLEGKNRLVLRAERFDGLDTPLAVTETILLPPDLPADNLRIVRKPSGTTIIEESWRF